MMRVPTRIAARRKRWRVIGGTAIGLTLSFFTFLLLGSPSETEILVGRRAGVHTAKLESYPLRYLRMPSKLSRALRSWKSEPPSIATETEREHRPEGRTRLTRFENAIGEDKPEIPNSPEATAKKVSLSDLEIPAYVRQRIQEENQTKPTSSGGGSVLSDSSAGSQEDSTEADSSNKDRYPNAYSFRIVSFQPGLTKSGEVISDEFPENYTNLSRRIVAPPDYSLATDEPMKGRLLTFGNGGVLVLEAVNGFIVDGDGPDFVVFENPFVVEGKDDFEVYADTAVVSVSEIDDPAEYRMFPCDSTNSPYRGCAGVNPVRYADWMPLDQVGGDLFDLADLGLSRARFIRIEDTGDNQTIAEGTEGLDLDSVALLNFETY